MENKSRKSLFELINSPFFLLIAGFLFTTLVGSYINNSFHEKSWQSKARFEIFKERLREAREAQQSILSLSNKRIFLLRRIYSELNEGRLQSAREIWKEYFSVVNEWNNNVKTNANLLSLLFGRSISVAFLDNTENRQDNPKSLHHTFRKAHDAVLSVIEGMKRNITQSEKDILMQEVKTRIDTLGLVHDDFSVRLRLSLEDKELKLLE
jgi:hypothetical protein